MKSAFDIKKKLLKDWDNFKFHKAWMQNSLEFPYQIKISRPTDKIVLHHFAEVQQWIRELSSEYAKHENIQLIFMDCLYAKMGHQSMPAMVEFADIKALSQYIGKWRRWQKFIKIQQQIRDSYPILQEWMSKYPSLLMKYEEQWPLLLSVCDFFRNHPKPGCYLRELTIKDVDSKFIESHKSILKTLLDIILPDTSINYDYEKLSHHGFEKRYGCRFEEPRIRFRILDKSMAADFMNLTDLEVPLSEFSKFSSEQLLCDKVYITENKLNGLVFPEIHNAIVIFGLGYGIQIVKEIHWLKHCQLYYWGDIDTHGFAILSQLRSYHPHVTSLLMDEETIYYCRSFWGAEEKNKAHSAIELAYLNNEEQKVYHKLKTHYWQKNLRLEQERIPFEYWKDKL